VTLATAANSSPQITLVSTAPSAASGLNRRIRTPLTLEGATTVAVTAGL
jgi:hypothetical protein